jgi:hypothetical protein
MRQTDTGRSADAVSGVPAHAAPPTALIIAEALSPPDGVPGSAGDPVESKSGWAAAWIDLGGEG